MRSITTLGALGRALRDARRRRGWTQAQLAQQAGTTQPKVSIIERGVGNPEASTLLALVAALGLDLVVRERPDADGSFPWDQDRG
ncbi:MAG: helix-turn-helix transcriptional regulator [Planctomycetota bacterium]